MKKIAFFLTFYMFNLQSLLSQTISDVIVGQDGNKAKISYSFKMQRFIRY